jgi:hypothetical protein
MPVAGLNNVATQNTYVDALTVEFGRPRPGFTMQVNNAGVFYTLGYLMPNLSGISWEPTEHFAQPAFIGFRNVATENLPPESSFGGVKIRSAATNVPARVSVA